MNKQINVKVAPKKGSYEWFKWMVERLGHKHAGEICQVTSDGELQAELYQKSVNEVRLALITLLAEMGVFKKVKEIKLPKGGEDGRS